jgi:hypothetical protein
VQDCFSGSPSAGLGAGIEGGCHFTLCWSSFAAEVFSNLSMAIPGIFLQESPAHVQYSAFDRELLACCAGIRHLQYMLEGGLSPSTRTTSHLPIALGKVADGWQAMQCQQAEFTTDIRHVPGVDNMVAETLSKPPPVAGPDSCKSALHAGPGSCQPTLHAGPGSCQPTLHAGLDG